MDRKRSVISKKPSTVRTNPLFAGPFFALTASLNTANERGTRIVIAALNSAGLTHKRPPAALVMQ